MTSKIYILLALMISLMTVACDVFPTRIPETPIVINQNFTPATTQSILISNFEKSIKLSDYNAYISCFASLKNGQKKGFEFVPSSDVASQYSTLFKNWGAQEEGRNFKSILAHTRSGTKIELSLDGAEFSDINSDSLIYTANYTLSLFAENENKESVYSGKILLNIYREESGIWYISKWIDILINNEEQYPSWSSLKVKYTI